jgi:isocitrate lyase
MITFGMVGIKSDNQVSQAFTIGELAEHQRKQLVPASEMLHVLVTIMIANDVVELVSI